MWVVREVDLGSDAAKGAGEYPAKEGGTYPCFVSAVDDDGNEVAGIRLPDIAVPVGTHTGWNPRNPETGAPEQIIPMQGFSRFFAPTDTDQCTSDERCSLETRYRDREAYLKRIEAAAKQLVADRYLLEEDIDIVIAACVVRYDTALGDE